jgi:hypothetical protein
VSIAIASQRAMNPTSGRSRLRVRTSLIGMPARGLSHRGEACARGVRVVTASAAAARAGA